MLCGKKNLKNLSNTTVYYSFSSTAYSTCTSLCTGKRFAEYSKIKQQ